jgi:hypothetical protein
VWSGGDALPLLDDTGIARVSRLDSDYPMRFIPACHDLPQERQVLLLVREVATALA